MPVRSAIGMKAAGVNRPRVLWFHLIKASSPVMRPVEISDLRLVIELELTMIESGTELVGDAYALMHPSIEVLAVEAVAIAPLVLGAVKREVGLHHHLFRPSGL